MAVFPWSHNRSRSTSTGKRQDVSLGWFARATTEPSRQALADLMKQHSHTISGSSASFQGRSRTNTASSQHSRYCSTTSQDSVPPSLRAQSPAVSVTSPVIRPESTNMSILSKSGDSRRQSSRSGIDSDSVSTMVVLSPPRFTPSRIGFRKKEQIVPSNESDRHRLSISKPYDFQHVSHTAQVEFNGLGRIDETELASRFSGVQDRQRSDSILRGIRTSDLRAATPPLSPRSRDRPQSPSMTSPLNLPTTPPRPTPPPKDSPSTAPASSYDVRMSRSVENFSRPTSRSAIPYNISPIRPFAAQPKLAPAAHISETKPSIRDSVKADFLQQAPAIGHAVSTQDDTARRMISAPLPPPPIDTSPLDYRSSHKRQNSSKGSLRHMSTFPSSRNPRPNMMSQDTQLLGIQEEVETMSRHRSDNELTRHLTRNDSYTSNSIDTVDDWEGAIDYAWEHEDDVFESSGAMVQSINSPTQESSIIVQQPLYEPISTPSTPLMMMGPDSHLPSTENTATPSTHAVTSEEYGNEKTASSMIGLGIESKHMSSSEPHSLPPSLAVTVPDQSHLLSDRSSRLPSTVYSAISKSSSQESIILSIASSILGTHRSSNSSVSPAEYAHLMKMEEPSSAMTYNSSSQLEAKPPKAARPESTCIPAELLQGFLDARTVQDVSSTPHAGQVEARQLKSPEAEKDEITPLPTREHRQKSTPDSSIPIPQRRSSISARVNHKHSRQGASTASSNRRQAGPSYSLFPSATSSVPMS